MSSKLTTANELQGMKDALGGIVQMTIIKRNLSLWWKPVSQHFQEGALKNVVADSTSSLRPKLSYQVEDYE
jgi:hypothetical protein